MNIKARYKQVKVLAEKGATEGERAAARAAMGRMEEKYPELRSSQSYLTQEAFREMVTKFTMDFTSANTTTSTTYVQQFDGTWKRI